MSIGRVLEEARLRAGLEISDIEERTKIRGGYLRALEDEEWEALPTLAYAKGFLRTYAGLVGLDAEAIVDEFRRQVEGGGESPTYPLGEGVLERRRRPGEPAWRPGIGTALAVGVLLVAGVLALIGVIGDGDEPRGKERRGPGPRAAGRGDERSPDTRDARPFTLALTAQEAVEVCLLDESERELIDGQVLAAGSREGPFRAQRFALRFPSGYDRGQFRLLIDGEAVRLPETLGPTAFSISPRGVEGAREPQLECP